MIGDSIGILILLVLGFCGLSWRQSAWSSHVDKRFDDLPADLGGRPNRIENRLDTCLDRRGASRYSDPELRKTRPGSRCRSSARRGQGDTP